MLKKLALLFIIYLTGLSIVSATYTWQGTIAPGQSIRVNDLVLTLEKSNTTGLIGLTIKTAKGEVLGLLPGENGQVKDLHIAFNLSGNIGVITISSEKPFSVSFNISDSQNEIAELKARVESLQKENAQLKEKLKNHPNTAELNARIVNLTKENRELKAELANLTNKYNALKAKADFLSQQNEEYRQIIQQVMNEQSSEAKQSYIEKAKKEKLVGSVLIKALITSFVVVGLIGYGLYRKKRSWEYPL